MHKSPGTCRAAKLNHTQCATHGHKEGSACQLWASVLLQAPPQHNRRNKGELQLPSASFAQLQVQACHHDLASKQHQSAASSEAHARACQLHVSSMQTYSHVWWLTQVVAKPCHASVPKPVLQPHVAALRHAQSELCECASDTSPRRQVSDCGKTAP